MKSTDDYYLLEELGQSFNETLVTKLLTSALNHSEPFTVAFVNVCNCEKYSKSSRNFRSTIHE